MMRKMAYLALVPLLLAACGSENGTTGPEPFGHITGVVHLEMCDLNPSWVRLCEEIGFGVSGTIDGVNIEATDRENGEEYFARTDDAGRYVIEVPPGTYTVLAPTKPTERDDIVVREPDRVVRVAEWELVVVDFPATVLPSAPQWQKGEDK